MQHDKGDRRYLLSDKDIRQIFKDQIKIIKYSEIKYYNDISELLAPYGRTMILIETSPNRGHWVCCFTGVQKQANKIFYFDSYGVIPDGQLKKIDKVTRHKLGEGLSDLVPLFHNYDILYNNHQLQSKIPGTATCGKWASCRMLLNNLNSDQFAKLFLNKKIKPDNIITNILNYYLQ